MGVMGAGKSTIGRALAQRLGCRFIEGDDLHTESNLRKLSSGVALTDEDRQPWVERVAAVIADARARRETIVVACSALTEKIRRRFTDASDHAVFVHLSGDPALVRSRLAARSGHFADPILLGSQYATLESPVNAITIDASRSPDEIVEAITRSLFAWGAT